MSLSNISLNKPAAWFCPLCKKFDLRESKENMASPEHVPYRGVDIGTCDGSMIALYEKEEDDVFK